MTSVFISYSSNDIQVADFVVDHLRNRGVDVFIDRERLNSGNFVEQLGAKIEEQKYFLVFISPSAVSQSKWVQAEVTWAFIEKDPEYIIPIWYKPAKLTKVFVLAGLERVDFTRWDTDRDMDDAIGKLCRLMSIEYDAQIAEPVREPMLNDTPVSESVIEDKSFPDDKGVPQFAKRDVAKIFQSAVSAQSEDPEKALYLYQRVLELDPYFMNGGIESFVKRQEEKMLPMRLYQLETRIKDARSYGLWEEVQLLAETMLDIDPNEPDASEYIVLAKQNIECEPIYQQAKIAFDGGNQSVVNLLMADIASNCPNYGDPSSILKGQAICRDLTPYVTIKSVLRGHTGPVKSVCFSPTGRYIATASKDDTVRIWSVISGEAVETLRHGANAMAFSKDEEYLVIADSHTRVILYRLKDWRPVHTFSGNTNCTDLEFTNDSKSLVTGWETGGLKVHNVPSLGEARTDLRTEQGNIESLSITEEGMLYANIYVPFVTVMRSIVQVWATDTWERVRLDAFEDVTRRVTRRNLEVSTDGQMLAYRGQDHLSIRLLPSGEEFWCYAVLGASPIVTDFALSPTDYALIAVAAKNNDGQHLSLFSASADERIRELNGHDGAVNAVAFSTDGVHLASGSDDCTAIIWQL